MPFMEKVKNCNWKILQTWLKIIYSFDLILVKAMHVSWLKLINTYGPIYEMSQASP